MDLKLVRKRILITGGNSGLGAAIAREFAREKARVAINYVKDPLATQALVADLRVVADDVLAIEADITKPGAVAEMFSQLDVAWGGIDVLVNCAGIDGVRAMAWEADTPSWDAVLAVNLRGAFLCARAALQRMVRQRSGVVLSVSSVHEEIAWSGYSAYAASKAALSMMAKTLAQEAGPFGVRVLCIAPGAIKTGINERVWKDAAGLKDLENKTALRRIGLPGDIAGLTTVLASDVAGYVTGTSLFVDGGMTDYPSFSKGG